MCECSCVWQFAHCAEYLVVLIYLRGPNLYKVLSSEATMMATTMTTTTTTTTTLAIATPQRLSHVCGKKYDWVSVSCLSHDDQNTWQEWFNFERKSEKLMIQNCHAKQFTNPIFKLNGSLTLRLMYRARCNISAFAHRCTWSLVLQRPSTVLSMS